jgi:hypothetical protein
MVVGTAGGKFFSSTGWSSPRNLMCHKQQAWQTNMPDRGKRK